MGARPRISVISYGGTIASVAKPGLGASPSLPMEEVARHIPGLSDVADLVFVPTKQVASPHMTMQDLLDMRMAVQDAVAQGSSGIVITQGTDTMEEIAFGLDLLGQGPEPVVVTGAMRNASMPGADGPGNLLAAVRVAASPAARGLGTLVVMNDEIHAARFVRKAHTQNPAAFQSAATGPLGWVAEADVRILTRPAASIHLDLPDGAAPAPVCLLKVGLGEDGRLLPYLAPAGFVGLVLEGLGGGHLTQELAAPERLDPILAQMPVVLASRVGRGEVLRSTYGGFIGSETDLIARGVIFASALDGPKARLLLSLLIVSGAERARIRDIFARFGPLSA
jgi:L-asparaginase